MDAGETISSLGPLFCAGFLWCFKCATIAILATLLIVKAYCVLTVGKCKSPRKMDGKTIIITGANSGVGLETAKELCRRNARVIMACRDLDKARFAAAEIAESTGVRPVCMQLDLCSFKSIRRFAKQVMEQESRLDVLINNAGKMAAGRKTGTEDGFESTLQTNHLGHFLLTNLLLDMLKKSAPSRIIVVGSNMIWLTKMDRSNIDFAQTYKPSDVYNASKLYNMLFVVELSRKLVGTGVTINCGHPGVVKTSIASRSNDFNSWMAYLILKFFGKTAEDGSQTIIHLAVAEELEAVSGRYFADCQQARAPPWATDPGDAQFLWKASEDMTGLC